MEVNNIDIYSVDDLQGIVDENIILRNDAAIIAYRIVKDTTNEFFEWIKTLSVEPTIKRLHTLADEIIEEKLNKAIKKSYVSKDDEENIKKLCQTIMNEFLHKPSKNIRDISTTIECDNTLNVAQKIFSIDNELQ